METTELELDENGSPVTIEAAAWYVCFVPGLVKQCGTHLCTNGTSMSSP